jgi:predicted DsbA family dithiol-disulfide isomerase
MSDSRDAAAERRERTTEPAAVRPQAGAGVSLPHNRAPATIEVFADVMCPFAHVGLRRLVNRRDDLGSSAMLRVRAWPLELVNGEPLAIDLVAEEVHALRKQVAPDLFAGFDPTRFPKTSLPAMAVAAAAYRRSAPLGERVSLAVRQALFEEGRDIAAADVLADIARAHHLTGPDAADRAAAFTDWREGRRRGVQGSPHFFVGDEGFFCPTLKITRVADRLQIDNDDATLEAFLRRAFPAT